MGIFFQDEDGTVVNRDREGYPFPEQCQYCFEHRLEQKQFISTLLAERDKEIAELKRRVK